MGRAIQKKDIAVRASAIDVTHKAVFIDSAEKSKLSPNTLKEIAERHYEEWVKMLVRADSNDKEKYVDGSLAITHKLVDQYGDSVARLVSMGVKLQVLNGEDDSINKELARNKGIITLERIKIMLEGAKK